MSAVAEPRWQRESFVASYGVAGLQVHPGCQRCSERVLLLNFCSCCLLLLVFVGDRSCHPRGGGAMSFFVRLFGIDRA